MTTQKLQRRLIWTDKVALGVLLAEFGMVGFLWIFAYFTVGRAGAHHMMRADGILAVELGLLGAGSVWVLLQGVDYAARGLSRLFTRYFGQTRVWIYDGQPGMNVGNPSRFRTAAPAAPYSDMTGASLWRPTTISRESLEGFDRPNF